MSPPGAQGWGLLCRRGQDEREIGFEMEVLDSTKPAFLLPRRAQEMTIYPSPTEGTGSRARREQG